MGLIQRAFNGKMNLDSSENRIPQSDYSNALNITRDSQEGAQDNIVTNILGNRKVAYALPAGTNKRIGSKADPKRNRIYYFIWNSNGNNLWLYYDKNTDTIVKVLEDLTDTNNIPVLAFNPSKKINHIDIFYREDEGDLIFWTDGNTSPKCANVQTILNGTYSTIKSAFIELAKMPPLQPPTCGYGSDLNKTGNALRRKLFQFAYRWNYDDFQKSTFSPYSKVALPKGVYGSDNDLDNSTNNFITVTITTGDENVSDIEIATRNNIGDAWGDFVLVTTINKAQYGLLDNTSYQFLFYNDALYPPLTDGVQYVDGVQVITLFDYVPQLCDALVLANGNIPVTAAITEGYNQFPTNDLDITMTVENIKNIPPDTNPPAMTYEQITAGIYTTFTFTVTGATPIPTGTLFKVIALVPSLPNPSIVLAEYTSVLNDDVADVCLALYNSVLANYPSYAYGYTSTTWQARLPVYSSIIQVIVIAGSSGGGTISEEKTWLWSSQYIFGLVYEDEQNRDMPGVITYSNPTDVDNDFVVNTPAFSEDSGVPKTPVISATINHIPPTNSKKFNWVRRRQTYGSFLYYLTCDYQDPNDGYLYFCLANIEAFKTNNSQFIYGSAPINSESRLKIIAGANTTIYNGDIYTQDYQIVGSVTRTLSGGSSPDDDKLFVKVVKPINPIMPAYNANMVVMVYTPSKNPTSLAESVYFEFGENYGIYEGYTINYSGLTGVFSVGEIITGSTSGSTAIVVGDLSSQLGISDLTGVFVNGETITGGTSGATATIVSVSVSSLYHRGLTQDQTSFQEALYTFQQGDVYYRQRDMYSNIQGTQPTTGYAKVTVPIMDGNYSDYFNSLVNDNGRTHAIEVNAGQKFNGVYVRFGEAYQSDTNVNGVNRFYFENFDTYDARFGNIAKLFIDKRYMLVFQQFDIGVVPVLTQIVKDVQGNPLQANSEILLNKIMYPYEGQYGIGNVPESFAFGKGSKYFVDNNKGVVCRLDANGITPLSVVYECNNFFVSRLGAYKTGLNNGYAPTGQPYTGNPTVYGIFDSYTNKYVVSLEEINRYDSGGNLIFHQDPQTLTFLEVRSPMEGFESKISCYPEGFENINNLLVAFKNGELWKHDNPIYCNFFGNQFSSFIECVFNDSLLMKKTWKAVTEIATDVWECPVIYTNVDSYAGQRQETFLLPSDFKTYESYPNASFRRDIHSQKGINNGDFMKGGFIAVRFQKNNASYLVTLSGVSVLFIESPLTAK